MARTREQAMKAEQAGRMARNVNGTQYKGDLITGIIAQVDTALPLTPKAKKLLALFEYLNTVEVEESDIEMERRTR